MKRYDLRHLQNDFYDRMIELIDGDLKAGEVGIFLFEIGDFSPIQKSADMIRAQGHDLMNSLKFNEVDWTVVVKKVDAETKKARLNAAEKSKIAAVKATEEEAEAKAEAEKLATEEAIAKAEVEKQAAETKATKEAEAEKEAEAKSAAQRAVQELKETKKAENTTKTDEAEASVEKAPVRRPPARTRRPAAKPRGKAK